jgi:HEAT repeat protein
MPRILLVVILFGWAYLAPCRAIAQAPDRHGSVTPPSSLREEVGLHPDIAVFVVQSVDRKEGSITFRKETDLKGNVADREVTHRLEELATSRDEQTILRWATPGKPVVVFVDENRAHVCVGNYWYLARSTDTPGVWYLQAFRGRPTPAYVGSVEKLSGYVKEILAGREVVITAEVPWDANRPTPIPRDWEHGRKGRVWRIKAGLKVESPVYSVRSQQFVGWGAGGPEVLAGLLTRLRHADARVRAEAAYDLGQLGRAARAAVPALARALADPDAHVNLHAGEALARIGGHVVRALPVIRAMLRAKDTAVRVQAAGVLADLGPVARPALPALVEALRGDSAREVRSAAAFALGSIGSGIESPEERSAAAVKALGRAACRDPSKEVRWWAVRMLARFGPAARAAIPALGAALEDNEGAVAAAAVGVLARFGTAALPVYEAALVRGPKNVPRQLVLQRLQRLGTRARSVKPLLVKLLRHEDFAVRYEAAAALLAVDPLETREGVGALVDLVGRELPHPWICEAAIWKLGQLGARARPAGLALRNRLKDKREMVRWRAVQSLGAIGPPGDDLATALIALAVSDKSEDVRLQGARALVALGEVRAGVALLVHIVEKEKDEFMRREAMWELGKIGPRADARLPPSYRVLRDNKDPVRAAAAFVVWRVDRPIRTSWWVADPRQEALAVLLELLQSKHESVRSGALSVLAEIGPPARRAIPHLLRALRDEECLVRAQAAEVMGIVGVHDRAARLALAQALGDGDKDVRIQAALALRRLDRAHIRAGEILADYLDSEFPLWREGDEVVEALGPDAKAVVPNLLRALRHEDDRVHAEAARLLKRIDPKGAARAGVP